MDLESERSVEDNESVETGKNGEIDTKTRDNGNYDAENVDDKLMDDIKVEGYLGKTEVLSPSPATKGWGLRKWRRIRRESGKESKSNLDSIRKRGMITLPVGIKQRSEGSSSSTNAMSNVVGDALDHNPLYGPDFASRADSENSGDQSSTAASAPRMNHEMPVVNLGIDLNIMRGLSGMNPRNLVQTGDQQEKGRNVKKKARGVKIKKENSLSSMESDSRSSNFVFMQGTNPVASNGRQSGRSGNYEEDDSDDAQNGGRHVNEEVRIAYSKNEADSENVSHEDLAGENSWEVKEEKVDRDALVECIMPLHLAQEALEREVQKLRDVGKDDTLSSDEEEFQSNKIMQNQNEVHLISKLEESLVMLELNKISELESALNFKDIKTEHEEILQQRITAELEYLVISTTIKNMKEASHIDQINLATPPEQLQHEDAWKLRNRVRRYASCFMFQSVLLFVVLNLFVLKFSSQTVEVIPT